MNGLYKYDAMTRAELLEHVQAYAEALHELAGKAMKLQGRLNLIERNRECFNSLTYENIKGA